MKNILISIALLVLSGCNDPQKQSVSTVNSNHKKEVLFVGTFHYNNPGLDVAKTKSFDVLSEESQRELEYMASQIKAYNPTKIFVEWPYDKQEQLDSLYSLYQKGTYFDNDSLSDFYKKGEIFQLAFRVADKLGLERVHGIDYRESQFPYQKVMADIDSNNQVQLKKDIEKAIADFSTGFDQMIVSGASLTELTLALNTKKMRYASNDLHNNMFPLAGSINDFTGVYLTSEWYRRNLYMWSLVQKYASDNDQRIMVLVGSSHAAMMELFVKGNEDYKSIELIEVLEKSPRQ